MVYRVLFKYVNDSIKHRMSASYRYCNANKWLGIHSHPVWEVCGSLPGERPDGLIGYRQYRRYQ
jgi:hypothetical protein